MANYQDYEDDYEEGEEKEPHFFCKLTFGQFFTLMVLEIITLCFVFYLGARYGNEYLKLDGIAEIKKEPISIVSKGSKTDLLPDKDAKELRKMAKDVVETGKVDLKKRVEEILARESGPTTPPVGEPSYNSTDYQENYATDTQHAVSPRDIEKPIDLQDIEKAMKELAEQDAVLNGTPQEVVKIKSSGDAQYSVQVGSYPDVKEASYRVEEWKAKGYPAYMMIADLGDRGKWFRVRIGAFEGQDDASRYLDDIRTKEGIDDAIVVKNEQ